MKLITAAFIVSATLIGTFYPKRNVPLPITRYCKQNNTYFNPHFQNNTKPDSLMTPYKTIEYQLEASPFSWDIAPGKSIEAWGYNHQVPGPVLRARRGDTLVIHFTNHLPEPTTIHWHGLRVPAAMDGTEEVQRPVMPGETFEYRLPLPDAGTFWYHPHSNETVKMERGLHGVIVVEDDEDPKVDGDRIFSLDDMKLNRKNKFKKPSWFLPRWLERHNGREGETLLVNGKENPDIPMAAGQTERWRFVNASSARYYNLSFGARSFQIIGSDGGLLEWPVPVTEILLTPGERLDILVGPFTEGENFEIATLPYDRGTGKGKKLKLATVKVGHAEPTLVVVPGSLRNIEWLTSPDTPVTKHIKLHGKRSWTDGADFMINDHMHLHDTPVRVGDLQVWEITNPSMLDHPFHLHGFFFQVLEVDGKIPAYKAWKDTYNVPRKGKIKIAWLPDDRPGQWMYHCHILEHSAAGMMAHFEIVPKDAMIPASFSPSSYSHTHH